MEKFSLVELLVSILIIAIVSTIVLKEVCSIIDKAYIIRNQIESKYDDIFILDQD